MLDVMQAEGKSIIFITHKLGEVIAFSDRVCVLRQGRVVAVKDNGETSPRELARLMVGREVLFRLEKTPAEPGEDVLVLENVHALNNRGLPALRGVSLRVRRGEILGIAGVAGNGQQELAEVITGLRPITEGKLSINGRDLTHCTPLEVIRSGVSHIPADRMGMGTVGDMAVAENIAMKGYRSPPLGNKGLLNRQRILSFARGLIEIFQISTPSPQTRVKFLSGGNIQKTILAREIDACAELLVAVYPSRGLDVGATEAVRRRLLEQRDAGRGVLLISEDLDELLMVADRIAVLYEGRMMGVVPAEDADVEQLGLMMAGAAAEATGAQAL
jgi:simple sugar transport system ATP-binding protein